MNNKEHIYVICIGGFFPTIQFKVIANSISNIYWFKKVRPVVAQSWLEIDFIVHLDLLSILPAYDVI